jgi:hypothetical protein
VLKLNPQQQQQQLQQRSEWKKGSECKGRVQHKLNPQQWDLIPHAILVCQYNNNAVNGKKGSESKGRVQARVQANLKAQLSAQTQSTTTTTTQ